MINLKALSDEDSKLAMMRAYVAATGELLTPTDAAEIVEQFRRLNLYIIESDVSL